MRRKWIVLFVAALAVAGLSACGSGGGDSAVSDADDIAGVVESVGLDNCLKCHDASSVETYTWLRSAHGNPNKSPSSLHVEGSSCQPCHNQKLEGGNLAELFLPGNQIGTTSLNVAVFADTVRDVAVCESCHGGGSAHRGIGPIPYPRPDWEQCVQCHDHPEGVRHSEDLGMLASNVGASAHNNADDLHASTTRCQRCHTAEGSVELAQYTGDADVMHLMDDLAPIDLEENLHPVTCAACHVPHSDELRADTAIALDYTLDTVTYNSAWDPNGNTVADQFDFCTSCHTYYNQDGVLIGSGSVDSGTAPFYHNTAWYRILPSTHYDDPTTGYGLTENIQEGYVLRADSDNPCFDCHGHELRTNTRRHLEDPALGADYGPTIHTDWANSRHGAELLKAKFAAADANPVTASRGEAGYEEQGTAQVDAVMAAGREDGEGYGWSWTHYDWDSMAGGFSGTGRQDCQRCHTSTGVSNFLSDPVNYVAANNDFSHLANWPSGATASSPQNEMLYCWGCHSNAQTGVLRDPGAITETYTPAAAGDLATTVTYPDINGSNVCMACHLGRETGEVIVNNADPDGVRDFINSHYLAAGASLFAESGYEYAGRNYANVAFYAHDQIGMGTDTDLAAWEAENGTPGPCVGCHMSSDQSHSFANVEKDDTGAITAITTTICANCHAGDYALTPAKLTDEEHEYQASIDALAAALTLPAVKIYYNPGRYPYFFTDAASALKFTNWESVYPDLPSDINWKNTMGAAFNLNLAGHEPGGYAHNRFYYKRLIWDAIDWIDDGVLNNSVPTAINTLETATTIDTATATAARTYLGTSRPGDPAP